jgi:hypothetical protein
LGAETKKMNEIYIAIEAKSKHSLQVAIHNFASEINDKGELIKVLYALPLIVSTFSEQISPITIGSIKIVDIVWYEYEHLIWGVGESFRQILKRNKSLRKEGELLEEFEKVVLNSAYGKGRQSFVMLLGQYGDHRQVKTLKQLLKDEEVQGHAIYSLRHIGTAEAQDDIRPFLESKTTWIRNEAKKYFKKLEKQRV